MAIVEDDEDRFQDALDILEDVVIPESHQAEASAAQVGGSRSIGRGVVLPAVSFNDQLSLQANKVADKWPQAMLLPKLPTQPTPAQPRPEQTLGIGRMTPKPRGMRADLALYGRHQR